MAAKCRKVDRHLILSLLQSKEIVVTTGPAPDVLKGERVLKQRKNPRKRSVNSDPRVDICCESKIMGINISYLVWMQHHQEVVPANFQIHHLDEDPSNNDISNLIAVHKNDHYKLHLSTSAEDETPF